MSNTIIQIKSSTNNSSPAELTAGELAYSYVSDKLFIGNSTGTGVNDVGGRLYVNAAVQAYNSANGAYDQANSANLLAFAIGEGLTTANAAITASYDQANAANVLAFSVGDALTTANASITSAYDKANSANILAFQIGEGLNSANLVASAAYDEANAANILAFAVGTGLNTVNISTEAAFGKANAANLLAFAVGEGLTTANAAITASYDKANSANLLALQVGGAVTTANAAIVASYDKANSANILAFQIGGGLTTANAVITSAYDKANTANILAFQVGGGLTSANASITAAYNKANSANILAFQVGDAVTAANLIASTAFDKANAANILTLQVGGAVTSANAIAIAAFTNANSKFSSSGGTITGDVSIVGNLTLSGNTVFIDSTRLQIDDPLIYLAGNNYTSDIVDIGFIANYVNATGSNVHTGIMRDHESKEYYVFQGYDKEPINNHIDPNGNNFTIAVLNATLKTSNLILGGINVIPWITSSYDKANSANLLAFNAFPNTTATFNGTLTISGDLISKGNVTLGDVSTNNIAFKTIGIERARISNLGSLLLGTSTDFTSSEASGGLKISGYGIYPYDGSMLFPYTSGSANNSTNYNSLVVINDAPFTSNGLASRTFSGSVFAPRGSNDGTGGAAGLTLNGFLSSPILSSSGTNARFNLRGGDFNALRQSPTDLSTNSGNSIRGVIAAATHSATLPNTSITSTAYAVSAAVQNYSGLMNTAISVSSILNLGSLSGSLTTDTSVRASAFDSTTFAIGRATGNNANVTNTYGVYLVGPTVAATGNVTNYYSLYSGTPTITGTLTNRYGIWINDPGASNYFAGNVGIGTSAITANLSVDGTANITGHALINTMNVVPTIQAAYDKANSTTYTSNVVISVADNTNAALRITQTGTGHAILVEDDTNPDSTPFVVDANGKVGIGTSNVSDFFPTIGFGPGVTAPTLRLETSNNVVPIISLYGNNPSLYGTTQATGVNSAGLNLRAYRSRGNTTNVSNVSTGDIIFVKRSFAYDNSAYRIVSQIQSGVESYNGIDDVSGYISFSTRSSGVAAASTERLRIAGSGNVGIGNISPTSLLHVNGTANIVSTLIVSDMNVVPTIQAAYGRANASYDIAVAAFIKANTANGSGGGGGSNTTYNIRTVITDTTLTVDDNMILVDGSANVTLPNAALNLSKSYEIKNINIGTINIVGIDNQLIDGYANVVIQYKNSTLGLRSVGSSWIIF